MSSDLRIKKLRGSGGYVMASVNDDEQRKGNLGGPDLFLAPIGRISPDKISKYFCNTCEADYEGSPKIEYENPNEEVAENLILAEKGQYACSTCGSTLAEYREFKKPDELGEVGVAKPMEPSFDTQMQAPPEPTPSFEMPDMQPPAPEPTFSQEIPTPEPVAETPTVPEFTMQETQSQPTGSINSIVGMTVFDETACKIGNAKQVGVDASQSLVLVITKIDGSEMTVPWTQVKKVGEIVLLGKQDEIQQTASTAQTIQQSGTCPNCNFANKPDSKFCEECGTKL